MSEYYPNTITVNGDECELYQKPPPCNKARCKHRGCRSCDGCGMTVDGKAYHCAYKGLDYHLRCAQLEPIIRTNDATFTLEKDGPSKCLWCNKHHSKGTSKNVPGLSYVSDEKGYSFHVNCVLEMASEKVESGIQLKPNGSNSRRNKWVEIFKIVLRTVISILIGDPTTILISTLAHLVTEGF